MGFGHRVYKNFDPRAKIIKVAADKVLSKLKQPDPLLDIAKKLEEAALNDPYFIERKLYPNVDFYSGIIYRALGIPTNMFTVMFAIGRTPGWIAHWKEMIEDPTTKIFRPRQIYTGPALDALRPARPARLVFTPHPRKRGVDRQVPGESGPLARAFGSAASSQLRRERRRKATSWRRALRGLPARPSRAGASLPAAAR